jgi:hypothetical protein
LRFFALQLETAWKLKCILSAVADLLFIMG